MENNVNPEVVEENGKVNIADEVVAVVASLAAESVDGVIAMSSGVAGGFAELLGKKNFAKGVKISKESDKIMLDLALNVEYGAKIPDVSWNVQDKVKNEVEAMTGLDVINVNVDIDGVGIAETEVASDDVAADKKADTNQKPNENETEEEPEK